MCVCINLLQLLVDGHGVQESFAICGFSFQRNLLSTSGNLLIFILSQGLPSNLQRPPEIDLLQHKVISYLFPRFE